MLRIQEPSIHEDRCNACNHGEGSGYASPDRASGKPIRSISEISSCFFGPKPWHIEIRHRVKKTSTINLFGFEALKLKIRRLKLWKPTVSCHIMLNTMQRHTTRHYCYQIISMISIVLVLLLVL